MVLAVRSPPANLTPERLDRAVAEGWHLQAGSLEYLPAGAGSHHWKLTGADGRPHFVTVDDLDRKSWLGDTRDTVFTGLGRALATAAALRHEAGLEFVVAPAAGLEGDLVRRLDDQYAVSVFPFLDGLSYPYGSYGDSQLREQALDMVAALHRSALPPDATVPAHVPGFGGRDDLEAFLADPDRPWNDGPFGGGVQGMLAPRAAGLTRLLGAFDRLVESTASARAATVITHGEPHPGNLMFVEGTLRLIDWDTAALAPPERDISVIVATDGEGLRQYQDRTGRELDPAVLTLYRAHWYLDDIASAIRIFRHRHRATADTRLWRDSVAPRLQLLPAWLDRLGA
jgi:spectinomycin phosphotransferase